ncbi:MAG: TRAP transporter large permease [Thermoanaerobacteraceae bacterium]|nr:TRAP transporter large permease [Thermoanaerobacteraceae bacterium]
MGAEMTAIWILIGSFLLMIILRFPIAYAVALSSFFTLVYLDLPLAIIAQQMVKGISSFSLMAVPFFITMGVIMGTGGISEKLIGLANACVGWMRGGLGMVNVLDSYFFGGISGSAAADTASLGSILIPIMVEQGYDADFSTAITIASSVEGILVPPSHNMVIYATVAGGVSVGSLFLAGYLPGAVLAISLMVGVYIISIKRNYPRGDKFSIKNLIKHMGESFWALATILIVVVGVVSGYFTATESAAIAVIYSLIVSLFIYKGVDLRGVWNALEECVDTLSIVLILISTSSVFGYLLTRLHVPTIAANAIMNFSDNPIVLAMLINLILLILGCIMDMAPIILITTPILLPIATSIGIHPVQYGIMLMLNCGIGLLTPPVGAVLYIGTAISKLPMERVVKAALPFYLCMVAALLLVTFIPAISLWIPSLFGMI